MTEDFIEKFAEVLECEPSELSGSTVFRDHPNWDSLAHLSTMAMIDENYDVSIPQDQFKKLKTVGELIDYIGANKDA